MDTELELEASINGRNEVVWRDAPDITLRYAI